MAELIQDRHVVAVLRPFVRATTPMLAGLRTLRRVALRPARWDRMSVEERETWWVDRVGRLTVLLASIPGLGGALADRLPLQDTLALAGQGLVLCAVAAERGVTAEADRVRLLAKVLFQRDIDPALAQCCPDQAAEDRETARLTGDLADSTSSRGRLTVRAAARAMWRFGRTLWALGDELDKRPQGRLYHRVLGWLPIVGVLGDYFGERSALKRAVRSARRWLAVPK